MPYATRINGVSDAPLSWNWQSASPKYGLTLLPPDTIIPLPRPMTNINLTGYFPGLSDKIMVIDNETGERWVMRDGEWVKTWTRISRATKSEAGQARYLRRYARNGKQ